MGVTDKIRQAFDECTVMAGVKNDFECVYITKAAALLYLNEIDDENAKLRKELEKWNRLAENIELPEYPVTEFHPKDLERENAKLRELAQNLRRVIPADVVGVVIGANTDHPSYYKFDEAFRELGVDDG